MHSLSLSFNAVIRICFLMFKMSNEYNNLCNGLKCTIYVCSVSRIKKCVLVLVLEIPCVILCEICFCSPVCLFVVMDARSASVHVIFCRCFFSYFFFMRALVGQTAERIFTKLSHVVDIRCYLRTY